MLGQEITTQTVYPYLTAVIMGFLQELLILHNLYDNADILHKQNYKDLRIIFQ